MDEDTTKTKSRAWCGTLNNYSDDEYQYYSEYCKRNCEYTVIGKEIGENKTPHLQATFYFKNARSFNSMKEAFPKWHLEKCKQLQASIEYCKKEKNFVEFGEQPKSQEQKGKIAADQYEQYIQWAKEGNMDMIPAKIRLTHMDKFEKIATRATMESGLQPTTFLSEWHWGDTGTGKSHSIRAKFGKRLVLKPLNKWWDSSLQRPTDPVLIEEVSPDACAINGTVQNLKMWCDKWPFAAEFKGGCVELRPERIIMTSNYSMEQCFPNKADYLPMRRRCIVFHYTRDDRGDVNITMTGPEQLPIVVPGKALTFVPPSSEDVEATPANETQEEKFVTPYQVIEEDDDDETSSDSDCSLPPAPLKLSRAKQWVSDKEIPPKKLKF